MRGRDALSEETAWKLFYQFRSRIFNLKRLLVVVFQDKKKVDDIIVKVEENDYGHNEEKLHNLWQIADWRQKGDAWNW